MKRVIPFLFLSAVVTVTPAISQNALTASELQAVKHLETTVPDSQLPIRFAALSINTAIGKPVWFT